MQRVYEAIAPRARVRARLEHGYLLLKVFFREPEVLWKRGKPNLFASCRQVQSAARAQGVKRDGGSQKQQNISEIARD